MEKLPETRNSRGFTMIELISVMVVIGILAALILPRFLGRGAFDALGVYNDLVGALRYAQKTAIASGCDTRVTISTGGYGVMQIANADCSGGFTAATADPVRQTPLAENNLHGVTLSPPSTITFTPLGAANVAATIAVSGAGTTRTLKVVAATGYIVTQ